MENSEPLGRQARQEIEFGISRLPILSAEQRSHWWGQGRTVLISAPYPGFEPGTFRATADFPNHCTAWSANTLGGGRIDIRLPSILFFHSLSHSLFFY